MDTSSPGPATPGAVVLGYGPMDAVHAEFTEVVERATFCSDTDFLAQLDAIVAHLRRHFAEEDCWMRERAYGGKPVVVHRQRKSLPQQDCLAHRVAMTGLSTSTRRIEE